MFIIMLEVEARQAVIWLPLTKNSVHCMILYLFLEDALAFLEPSFCASVS